MTNANLSHLGDSDPEVTENDFSKIANSNNGDYKILVPNVDQIHKEDRIHLLLDMPGLDEASCEIELVPGRVTVYGKLTKFSSCNETGHLSSAKHGLLKKMRTEQAQQFQYFFDIPLGFEDLQHAQFVEGTLHICVDRLEFQDLEQESYRSLN